MEKDLVTHLCGKWFLPSCSPYLSLCPSGESRLHHSAQQKSTRRLSNDGVSHQMAEFRFRFSKYYEFEAFKEAQFRCSSQKSGPDHGVSTTLPERSHFRAFRSLSDVRGSPPKLGSKMRLCSEASDVLNPSAGPSTRKRKTEDTGDSFANSLSRYR